MIGPRRKPGPKGDRTIRLDVRITKAGIAEIDRRAELAGVKRSEMARRMLAYAAQKMPDAQ